MHRTKKQDDVHLRACKVPQEDICERDGAAEYANVEPPTNPASYMQNGDRAVVPLRPTSAGDLLFQHLYFLLFRCTASVKVNVVERNLPLETRVDLEIRLDNGEFLLELGQDRRQPVAETQRFDGELAVLGRTIEQVDGRPDSFDVAISNI